VPRFNKRTWVIIAILGIVAVSVLALRIDLSQPVVQPSHTRAHPIGRFLAHYWADPLPPQGSPPQAYSALEASLAPESCGQCHPEQYKEWRTSLHSDSIGPGLLWQFRILNPTQANTCMRCHAPLAEQKALAALEFHWPNAPSSPPPAYVGRQLFRQGLVCADCHVRRHRRFGPPPPPGMPPGNTRGLPHGGFTASKACQDSRFCATCHQFPPGYPSLNGKPFENTYAEWRTSRFARAGITCQSCHMPGRRHLWRGIHDPAMVRQGLRITLTVTRASKAAAGARAVIHSVAIGHDFPTYLVPKIYVTLYALGSHTGDIRELAHHVIGRSANLQLTHEFFDTRIPPGGKSVLAARFPLNPSHPMKIELRIEVAPGAHYERLFRHELKQTGRYDKTTVALLRQALAQTIATRYQLIRLVVPVPATIGSVKRAVAN